MKDEEDEKGKRRKTNKKDRRVCKQTKNNFTCWRDVS